MADGIRVGDRVEMRFVGEVSDWIPLLSTTEIVVEGGGRVVLYGAAIRHVRRLDDPAAEPILGPHSE